MKKERLRSSTAVRGANREARNKADKRFRAKSPLEALQSSAMLSVGRSSLHTRPGSQLSSAFGNAFSSTQKIESNEVTASVSKALQLKSGNASAGGDNRNISEQFTTNKIDEILNYTQLIDKAPKRVLNNN